MIDMKFRWCPSLAIPCLVGVVVIGLCGCGGNGNSLLGPSSNSSSRVRTFDALDGGNAPAVNFVETGTQTVINQSGGLTLGQTAPPGLITLPNGQQSNYYSLPAANGVAVGVFPTGTAISGSNQIASASVDFDTHDAANTGFETLIAMGVYGQPANSALAPVLVRFVDSIPATIGANQVAIRLINASPDAPAVNLYSTSNGIASQLLSQAVTYKSSTSYQLIPLTGGTQAFTLSVYNGASAYPLATFPSSVTLVGGHSYTFIFAGQVSSGGTPTDLFVLGDL